MKFLHKRNMTSTKKVGKRKLIFAFWRPKKKPSANGKKAIFFWFQIKCENRHIFKKKKLQVAIFIQWVSICRQKWAGIFFFSYNLLYCQIYSQIWLIPLVDDRQKPKKKEKDKSTRSSGTANKLWAKQAAEQWRRGVARKRQ